MKLTVKVSGLDKVAKQLKTIKDVPALRQAVLAGALMIESAAKENISHGAKTGRVYTRGNIVHQASAPGEAPATDSGHLISSISHWDKSPDGLVLEVGSIAPHAAPLEYGTPNMEPRPFIHPALEEKRAAITKRIAQALKPKKVANA